MHKLAREHVSGWRHLHENMSLESEDRKISQQSCILRSVRQLKSRTVTRRAGYINGKKIRRQRRCHM